MLIWEPSLGICRFLRSEQLLLHNAPASSFIQSSNFDCQFHKKVQDLPVQEMKDGNDNQDSHQQSDHPQLNPPQLDEESESEVPATSTSITPSAPLFTLPFALYLEPLPTRVYHTKSTSKRRDSEDPIESPPSDHVSSSSSCSSSSSSSNRSNSSVKSNRSSKSLSLGPNARLSPKKHRSAPHDLTTLEAVLSVANPQSASHPVAKLLSLLEKADDTPGFDRLREFFDTRYDLPSTSTTSTTTSRSNPQRKPSLPATLSKLRKGSTSSNSNRPSSSSIHLKHDLEALESANAFNPNLYSVTLEEGEDLEMLLQSSSASKVKSSSQSRKKKSSKAPRLVLPSRKSSSSSSPSRTIPPKVIRFPVRLDLHSIKLAPKPKINRARRSRSVLSGGSSLGKGSSRKFRGLGGSGKGKGKGIKNRQVSAESVALAGSSVRNASTGSFRKGALARTRRVASDGHAESGAGNRNSTSNFNSEIIGHPLQPVTSPESGYSASIATGVGGNSGWALSTSPEKSVLEISKSGEDSNQSPASLNGSNSRGNSSAVPSSWRAGTGTSVTTASNAGGERKDSFASSAAEKEGTRRPSMVQRFLDFGGLRKKNRSRSATGGSDMSRRSASSASASEDQGQIQAAPPAPPVPSVIASSKPSDFPSNLKMSESNQANAPLAAPIELSHTDTSRMPFSSSQKELALSRTISPSSNSDDAHAQAIEDEDDPDDVEAHWTRRRAAKANGKRVNGGSFGESGRRLFKSPSASGFGASEHDLGPVREGHAWAADTGHGRESSQGGGEGDLDDDDDSFGEEEEDRSLWDGDQDGSEVFPITEGEDFLSLLRQAAQLSLSPDFIFSTKSEEETNPILSGLESRGSQSQTPRGGLSPRGSFQLSDRALGKLPESNGSRSPLTPNGKAAQTIPSLLSSSSSSSLHQVTPPGSFELERQAELNVDVEAVAEANARAEARFKDAEKAPWWPSGSSDPFPVVVSLALGLHFGWEGIMSLCYGPGSNSCPPPPQGQDPSLAAGDFAPLGRAADMEERGRRGAGRVSDWWAGVKDAHQSEEIASEVGINGDAKISSPKEVSEPLEPNLATPQHPESATLADDLHLHKTRSEVAIEDSEDEFDPNPGGMERSTSTRFGKWLGVKSRGGRAGSMSSSKGSFRRSSISGGSEDELGAGGPNRPPSPSVSQLGAIKAKERAQLKAQVKEAQDRNRNRTWKDWSNLAKSIKGWVDCYETARIRAGLAREIGVDPLSSQVNPVDIKSESALTDEEDEGVFPSLMNHLNPTSSTQPLGIDSGFHEKTKPNGTQIDSSMLNAGSHQKDRGRRPSVTSSKSGFSESSSLAPPRSSISDISASQTSATSSNPVFSPTPIPECVLKDITEREHGFRRAAGIPDGLAIGEDGEEHHDYRWSKSRLRRKEVGTSASE